MIAPNDQPQGSYTPVKLSEQLTRRIAMTLSARRNFRGSADRLEHQHHLFEVGRSWPIKLKAVHFRRRLVGALRIRRPLIFPARSLSGPEAAGGASSGSAQ